MTARLFALLCACDFAPVTEPRPGGADAAPPRATAPRPDPCDRAEIVAPKGRALCQAVAAERRAAP